MNLAEAHRFGLQQIREAARHTIAGQDREAARLADVEALDVAGHDARLYRPHGIKLGSPLIVYFHGGGFVFGGLDTHEALCQRLAHHAGALVLSVSYRLAPEHPFPAQLEDAHAAVAWALEHARGLGADPRKVALSGDSAGAYISIASAREYPGMICGLILLYPLLQLDDDAWSKAMLENLRGLGRMAVKFIQKELAADAIPSLMDAADRSSPPMVLFPGGLLDPVRPDALTFARRAASMGATCEVIDGPGHRQVHGFLNFTHLVPDARAVIEEVGAAAKKLMFA